jgi:hypothetical protein
MEIARIELLPDGSDADVRVLLPVSTRCGLQYGLQWSKTVNGSNRFDSQNADLGPRRLRLCPRQPRAYPRATGLSRPPQHPTHGEVHRIGTDAD